MSTKQKKKPKDRSDARVRSVRVAGVTITHPNKVLWPGTKHTKAITKLDLARYYAASASRMLPNIADRPISVLRAPRGIMKAKFFQRHKLAETASAIQSIRLRGSASPFLSVGNRRALVALAQAAVLEIHPWGSKRGHPNVPARIVFDLDPAPGLPFECVVQAAKVFRKQLDRCELVPFVKTTGGKGLHVVVAIRGDGTKPPTWDDAKSFAKALCKTIERDNPRRYTTNPSKRARRGKIYLDYLRNVQTASSVAPWSPRARQGAPIATPLAWSQLRAGLNPKRFTLSNYGKLLRRSDPWKGLPKSTHSLSHAALRLASVSERRSDATGHSRKRK